jgi:large subunit ribosomal protein L10
MAITEKEQEVRELAELLANAKSIYLTDFQGMNVDLVSRMRRKLRDAKVEYRVAKNTLT